MASTVGILDYGIGNVRSIINAFSHVGAEPELVRVPEQVSNYDRLVVPGVGAFAHVYATLQSSGLIEPLLEAVRGGRPTLGICVGMQILFDRGLEFDGSNGLGLIAGEVRHLKEVVRDNDVRLPVIGWQNTVAGNVPTGKYYFLHSFAAAPVDASVVYETYQLDGHAVTASVVRDNLSGTQYHPERSGKDGLGLLSHFMEKGSIKQ